MLYSTEALKAIDSIEATLQDHKGTADEPEGFGIFLLKQNENWGTLVWSYSPEHDKYAGMSSKERVAAFLKEIDWFPNKDVAIEKFETWEG